MLKNEIGQYKIDLQKEREKQRKLLKRTMELGQETNESSAGDDPMRLNSLECSRLKYKLECCHGTLRLAETYRRHESDYRAAVAKEQRLVQMRYSNRLEEMRKELR